MKTLEWYFDYISPFAYLQSRRVDDFAMHALIRRIPVLFAGLLNHWEQKGPAEIAPKRVWTFEHVAWLAHKNNIPIRMPAHHPFNPLPLLRLSALLGDSGEVVDRLFAWVWQEGHVPTQEGPWQALLAEFRVEPDEIETAEVKAAIRANTEAAIAAGVFGVPTARLGDELFWGFDATDMVLARLGDDPFFGSPLLADARALPGGVQRPNLRRD